jgi:integrase
MTTTQNASAGPAAIRTEADIRSIKVVDRGRYVPTLKGSGLFLRLHAPTRNAPAGRRQWVFRTTKGGGFREVVLGAWPGVSLEAARAAAARERERASGTTIERASLRDAAAEWYRTEVEHKYRSEPIDTYRYITRDLAPLLSRRVDQIDGPMLARAIGAKKQASPSAARRMFRVVAQFFRWAKVHGYTDRNPTDGWTAKTLALGKYEPRQVTATDDQIRALWALDGDDPSTRALRFALLTGCRIGEALGMEPEQIKTQGKGRAERATWTIQLTKNGRPHSVPLSASALALARQGWASTSYMTVLRHFRRAFPAGINVHDLRRTAATRMRQRPISARVEVVEAILNHAPPTLQAIYQVADLHEDMRDALDAWGAEVARIIAAKPSTRGRAK